MDSVSEIEELHALVQEKNALIEKLFQVLIQNGYLGKEIEEELRQRQLRSMV